MASKSTSGRGGSFTWQDVHLLHEAANRAGEMGEDDEARALNELADRIMEIVEERRDDA